MPLSGPSAAALQRRVHFFARSSSCRPARRGRRTETFGVGTRIANAVELALQLGQHFADRHAAPVVVGIIDSAAARARRRSLCGRSSSCWSLV